MVDKKCPKCQYELDASTPIGEKEEVTPREGDISICINCAAWLSFNKDLSYSLLSEEKVNELKEKEPRAYEIMTMAEKGVKQIIAEKRKNIN